MKREENEKKKSKSFTQKAKKIRSIVMMSLLCVLLLSAATYAWFTLSDTAKVSNLTMTVGDVTGLQIARDKNAISNENGPDTYGSQLEFGSTSEYQIKGKLLPATLANDETTIKKPTYNDGAVTGIEAVDGSYLTNKSDDNTKEGYYYETTFYLKSVGKDISVQLADGTTSEGNELPATGIEVGGEKGTFVLNASTQKSGAKNGETHIGARAIRIWLSTGNSEIIYQPNYNLSDGKTYTTASDISGKTAKAPTDKQDKNGTFVAEKRGKLNLLADQNTLVTMRIWLEGTDTACGNEIILEDIIAQLQFEEAPATGGSN